MLDAPAYTDGTVHDLAEALRHCYEQLVKDTTIELAVEKIESIIEIFLDSVRVQPAASARMAQALGMRETLEGKPLTELTPKERRAVNRIGALIVVNAMIFQEVLSQKCLGSA